MRILLLACIGACAANPAEGPRDHGDPRVVEAVCEPTDNPLRALCTVRLDAAGPIDLVATAPGLPTRTFQSTQSTRRHAILMWALHPDTQYTWTAGALEGSFDTGPLPPEVAQIDVRVEGEAHGFDVVVEPVRCADGWYFVMVDPDGTVVWYERSDLYDNRGWDWYEQDQRVLASATGRYGEIGLDGSLYNLLSRGEHFDHTLHHDVAKWNGFVYLLQEYPNPPYEDLDLIEVFDGPLSLGSFRYEPWFDVTSPSVGDDWAHTNGINPTPEGELILTLHHFDMILGIDGDPESPTFLQITLQANGSNRSLTERTPDASVLDPAAMFRSPHGGRRDGDSLLVLDNEGAATTRGLRFDLDFDSGEMKQTGEWHFDGVCPIQGGAAALDGGGVLLSCPATGAGWAFAEGGIEPEWTIQTLCHGGSNSRSKILPVRVH